MFGSMRSRRSATAAVDSTSSTSSSSAGVVIECPPPLSITSTSSSPSGNSDAPTAQPQQQQQQQQQQSTSNTNVKVEGEIVNDLERLKSVLDRGWDLNKKVIGNWYLLLWPPQTLLWWCVDYNKPDSLKLLLSKTEALSDRAQIHTICDTIKDALQWSRRKANETLTEVLDLELQRLLRKAHDLSRQQQQQASLDDQHLNSSLVWEHLVHTRRQARSYSSVSMDSSASSSLLYHDQNDDDQDIESPWLDADMLLAKMDSLRHEQTRVASQVEFLRARAELDLENTNEKLELEQARLAEMESTHESALRAFRSAREQLEIARSMLEAAQANFHSEETKMESVKTDLGEARSKVDLLKTRKSKLDLVTKKVGESMQSMLCPIQVECACGTASKLLLLEQEQQEKSKKQKEQHTTTTKDEYDEVDSKMKVSVECPVCRDQKISKSFQCGHALCKECVKSIQDYAGRRVTSPGSFFLSGEDVRARCPICKAIIESIHPLYL